MGTTVKKPAYQIPFSNGVMMHYPETWRSDRIEWKDNYTFYAKMKYSGYGRGRSSAIIYLEDIETKKVYPMFLSCFDDLMKCDRAGIHENGELHFIAEWTFCKKDENYSLKMVPMK